MLVSYKWLSNYLDLPSAAETVVKRLIQAGVAVERTRTLGGSLSNVVVAELLEVSKHPQADRLSLTRVTDGKETFQVVCGAKNIAVGQKVPLARVGAVLPGDFAIKPAKIRGVESFGMLCSSKELGFTEESEGILILPADAGIGTELAAYLGLPDTLFELEITPNRADLLSHWGVAREVAALFNLPLRYPASPALTEGSSPASGLAGVTVEAADLCRLYSGRVIEGVRVGPSPRWLSQALERVGQRSINNVVDVTNFVLLELGQPLHAFDLGQLHGSRVVARRARAGEKIPLLDGSEKELKPDMLVIADADRPVALAGIMGGSNSQVTISTRTILLESALFLPGSVRKTARLLNLSTDSSYRFERGVDPAGVLRALDRAAALIAETAGGQIARGVLKADSRTDQPARVDYRPSRADSLLGTQLGPERQSAILKSLGCAVTGGDASPVWSVEAPSWRLDLVREIDLIEEIARVNGYENIPITAPRIPSGLSGLVPVNPLEDEIRSVFSEFGIHEAVNSTFLPSGFADKLKLGSEHPLRRFQEVANPIADDQRVLRPTLLPSLLSNVQLNLSHQQEYAALYELDKVFTPLGGGKVSERFQATAVLAGSIEPRWNAPGRTTDFYDVKGLAEDLISRCRLEDAVWAFGAAPEPYAASMNFQVKDRNGALLLTGGALSPKSLKEYDIAAPCFALEVEMEKFQTMAGTPLSFSPLPKFPSASRDIALMVPDGVTSAQVMADIISLGKPELREVRLFDLYQGPTLGPGFRSLAYRLVFRNEERTLLDQEVADIMARILGHLKERYSIAIR